MLRRGAAQFESVQRLVSPASSVPGNPLKECRERWRSGSVERIGQRMAASTEEIARQIVEKTGDGEGLCPDIGILCGTYCRVKMPRNARQECGWECLMIGQRLPRVLPVGICGKQTGFRVHVGGVRWGLSSSTVTGKS